MNPTTRILTLFLIVPVVLIQAAKTPTSKTLEVISESKNLENVYVQYMQKVLNQTIDLKQEFPDLTMDDMNNITAALKGKNTKGPAAFVACVGGLAGPVCAGSATTATAACAAIVWLPPGWVACMVGAIGLPCAGTVAVCVAAFFAPTP